MIFATGDPRPEAFGWAIHQEFAEGGVARLIYVSFFRGEQASSAEEGRKGGREGAVRGACACKRTAYSTTPLNPDNKNGRLNTHADGGLSTISQRRGPVRAGERRAI